MVRYWSSEDERRDFCKGLVRIYRACLSICWRYSIQGSFKRRRHREKKYLSYPRPKERPHKKFEPLELCLDNYEAKVGFRVHVARLRFYQIDLPVPNKAFN